MTETIDNFISLLTTLIIVLVIVSILFTPKGMASSVFAYESYAEPRTLVDHISTAMSTLSTKPGSAESYVRTSGIPYIIKVYRQGNIDYITIDFSVAEQKTNVQYGDMEPVPILSNCLIEQQELALKDGIVHELKIKKVKDEGSTCRIFIESRKVEVE